MIASRSPLLAGAFTSPALQKSSEWPSSKHGEARILAPLLWTRSYPTSKRRPQLQNLADRGAGLHNSVLRENGIHCCWRWFSRGEHSPSRNGKVRLRLVSSTCCAILGQDLLKLAVPPVTAPDQQFGHRVYP